MKQKQHSSSNAMEKASLQASLQVVIAGTIECVTKERDESALQFSVSREHVLANLKLVLIEWIEKADSLEGKLVVLQGCWDKANAGLDLK